MQFIWIVLLTLQRSISGLQNMYGYKLQAKTSTIVGLMSTTVVLLAITAALGFDLAVGEDRVVNSVPVQIVIGLLTLIAILSVLFVANAFYIKTKNVTDRSKVKSKDGESIEYEQGIDIPFLPLKVEKDIHLWEYTATGALMLAAIVGGVDIIYAIASVTIGMVFHKGFINLGVGRPFLDPDEITNDPTGQTFDIPSLDIIYRRLVKDGRVRVLYAIAGLVYILLNEYLMHWTISLPNIVDFIF